MVPKGLVLVVLVLLVVLVVLVVLAVFAVLVVEVAVRGKGPVTKIKVVFLNVF